MAENTSGSENTGNENESAKPELSELSKDNTQTDRSSSGSKKPANVSDAAWQKFQKLKEKRLAISQKSKHRLKQKESKSKALEDEANSNDPGTSNDAETEIEQSDGQNNWEEVKNYLGEFDNLEAACVEQHQEKSGLEKRLEKALEEGNIDEAEELSDQLANRQFGAKIANAFDAQRFKKRQKEKEEDLKEKKKRKLNWQFEHKEKWEMKANM